MFFFEVSLKFMTCPRIVIKIFRKTSLKKFLHTAENFTYKKSPLKKQPIVEISIQHNRELVVT